MRVEIAKLHKRLQTTMVYVTHDQVEAMTLGTKIIVMKDGDIQQIDSPTNIYNKPANLFVAGFIGSPMINLVGGVIIQGRFTAGNLDTNLDKMDLFIEEGSMIMGIRPENMHLQREDGNDGAVTAVVELTEPMGAETHLYLRDGEQQFIARVKPDIPFQIGDKIKLHFSSSQIHFFDPVSEERARIETGERAVM